MKKSPRRRRGMLAAVWLALVGLSVIYLFVGDRTLWGAWISVAPPMVWVVLFLPTAVRLRSASLFVALLGFAALTTEWARFPTRASTTSQTIRVVSWNIGAGNSGWAESVQAYEPDIVFVQEGMKPKSVWEGYQWFGTLDPGTLTRFPAESLPTEKVGPWIEPQLLLTEIRGKKLLLANVRLMLPSVVIQLVRPFAENPAENYRARIGQYRKLAELLQKTALSTGADAIVLAGDFNCPATLPSLSPLREFLQDVWLTAGSGWGATVPEFLPFSRIDQIWVSPKLKPILVRVERMEGSDHRAVVMDLAI